MITHPEIPTCSECKTWMYDPDWKRSTRAGEYQRRPQGAKTPCYSCPKSSDRATPNPAADLSPRNWAAYKLYLRIKAGMPMPDDEIVRENCGLIREVEDEIERSRQLTPMLMLAAMLRKG